MSSLEPLNSLLEETIQRQKERQQEEWEMVANSMPFTDFLQDTPPGVDALVAGVVDCSGESRRVSTPPLQLHCSHDSCSRISTFRRDSNKRIYVDEGGGDLFLLYRCSCCQEETKVFALRIVPSGVRSLATCEKYGERPSFGPPMPRKLSKLLEPDKKLFIKGRRSENQGLGIGAFAYYRRVVEGQRVRLLDSIIRLAERMNADPASIETLRAAREEQRFGEAMRMTKDVMPPALLIDGHNPLTLLHKALSIGLHDPEADDAACLERAHVVRTLLQDLSQRLAALLKEDAELKKALGSLLNT